MPDRGDHYDPDDGHQRPHLPDAALVERAATGDPRAFEQLVRRHQRQMYRTALRVTGRPDDAEDATQNAFVAAWRRLPEFRGDAAFSTWMHRIVTNHALNQVRARSRSDRQADVTDLPDRDQPVAVSTGPSQQAETGALVSELRAALATLPPELRACWYAREIDGCSYQEVAARTGVGLDVARGRIARARRRLAETMQAWR